MYVFLCPEKVHSQPLFQLTLYHGRRHKIPIQNHSPRQKSIKYQLVPNNTSANHKVSLFQQHLDISRVFGHALFQCVFVLLPSTRQRNGSVHTDQLQPIICAQVCVTHNEQHGETIIDGKRRIPSADLAERRQLTKPGIWAFNQFS